MLDCGAVARSKVFTNALQMHFFASYGPSLKGASLSRPQVPTGSGYCGTRRSRAHRGAAQARVVLSFSGKRTALLAISGGTPPRRCAPGVDWLLGSSWRRLAAGLILASTVLPTVRCHAANKFAQRTPRSAGMKLSSRSSGDLTERSTSSICTARRSRRSEV